MCRLLGFITVIGTLVFETDGFATQGVARVVWIPDAVVALLLGNLVKECAVYLCSRILNALGRDFYRRGVLFDGTPFSERFHADGTWRRFEYRPQHTVCEWTDNFGACYRRVLSKAGTA